jgi:hypothetical protein
MWKFSTAKSLEALSGRAGEAERGVAFYAEILTKIIGRELRLIISLRDKK